MPRKTLRVQVELDIQAVTCPGVWLCPNGKVSLQLFMLDSCIQTTGLTPVFPLLYHEKFVFYKNFYSAYSLSELQRLINKEFLYAELIQWQNCDMGNVIASFQTSLYDVLYPASYEGAISGVDVDLLMEPSKIFPGIIAPKIEISTRTTVEEVVCFDDQKKRSSFAVNPKTVSSDPCPCEPKHKQTRQQRVCHSVGYHKTKRCSKVRRAVKPPFLYRKAEDELIARKPQGPANDSTKKCKCCFCSQSMNTLLDNKQDFYSQSASEKGYIKAVEEALNQYPRPAKMRSKGSPKKAKMCSCGSGHTQANCPLCSKYRYYFEGNQYACTPPTKTAGHKRSSMRDNYVRKITTCSPVRDGDGHSSRSPVKTVGKDHYRQAKAMQCGCSPSRTTFDSVGREPKMCDCSPVSNDDNTSRMTCYCPPQKKPSLAEQIHHRLMQTLDCAPPYPFVQCRHQPNSGSASLCSCPKFRNCKEGFYKNLGKFYRDLRRC